MSSRLRDQNRANAIHMLLIDHSTSVDLKCGRVSRQSNSIRYSTAWENITCGMCLYLGRGDIKQKEVTASNRSK